MKKIVEQTSSASSGSFETQMGSGMVRRNFHPFFDIDSEEVQPKKKKKQLNKKKKPMKKITISEIENIILKTLIHEEVYSEKPIESKGKDISSKNAKSKVTTKTSKKIDDITSKSGKESKSDVSGRTKKVSDSLKNNLKGAEVKDVNKDKKVNDDYETEAYQNGMEDIAYERISDEQKEKNTKYIKSSEMRKNPNAEKSGKAADKMIKQTKQRGEAKKRNPFNSTYSLGKDMEFLNNKDKELTPRKKLGVNENTIKRLTFESQFRDDKDMLKKIPSKYKQNDLVFEMYDGDSNYRVRWEGTENNGVGVIIEHKSASKEMKNMKMFESLNKFESLDFQPERNVQSSNLNENQIFKQMLNQSRRLINEADGDSTKIGLTTNDTGERMNFSQKDDSGGTGANMWRSIELFSNGKIKTDGAAPAPEPKMTVDTYNKILSGEASYGGGKKYDFGVRWQGETVNYKDGEFVLTKDFNPTEKNVESGKDEKTAAIGTKIGLTTNDTGERMNFSQKDGSGGTGANMWRSIELFSNGKIKTDGAAPAPEPKMTVDTYNKILSGEASYGGGKKYDFGVRWQGETVNYKDGEFVLTKDFNPDANANIAQTGEEVYKLNYDNAYNYLKIGDKFYVQKKGRGNAKDPKQYVFVDPSKNKAAYDAIKSQVFV